MAATTSAADRRRARKQKKKSNKRALALSRQKAIAANAAAASEEEEEVVVEYSDPSEPPPAAFREVFERFARSGARGDLGGEEGPSTTTTREDGGDEEVVEPTYYDDDDRDGDQKSPSVLPSRRQRLRSRYPLHVLRSLAPNPSCVEGWDSTAADPVLLVHLKSYRNSLPVPAHWSQKRQYLSGKRGIEKPPFQLPQFIRATGIEGMRQTGALDDGDDSSAKLKSKTRAALNPKMGKIDIDYQVLHDAFFKHQTKPRLSRFGEVYYEGKEFESDQSRQKLRPGFLSAEAREALGMVGPGADLAPPPYLVNMQRYGPPPSYPNLVIPGLNAPIPEGASFGHQPGGWGRPPVDEAGNPLYGDVFGLARARARARDAADATRRPGEVSTKVDYSWGAMESEEESESEYEEVSNPEDLDDDEDMSVTDDDEQQQQKEQREEEEEEEEEEEAPGMVGFAEGEAVNLRKDAGPAPELYKVLEEREKSVGGGDLMGSEKVYVVGGNEKKKGDSGEAPAAAPPRHQQDKDKKKKKKEKEFKF